MTLHPFLASLFLRGLFCLARFGVFRPISALRAAYGGCAPKRAFCEADVPEGARSDPSGLGAEMLTPYKSISPSAMGDQGAALDLCPSGTWATPSPLKRAALNFTPFVTQSLS